jgi:hypothetical protein
MSRPTKPLILLSDQTEGFNTNCTATPYIAASLFLPLAGVCAQLVGRRLHKRSPGLTGWALEQINVVVKVVHAVTMLSITCGLLERMERVTQPAW